MADRLPSWALPVLVAVSTGLIALYGGLPIVGGSSFTIGDGLTVTAATVSLLGAMAVFHLRRQTDAQNRARTVWFASLLLLLLVPLFDGVSDISQPGFRSLTLAWAGGLILVVVFVISAAVLDIDRVQWETYGF